MSEMLKQKALVISKAFTKWNLWQGGSTGPQIKHKRVTGTTNAQGYLRVLTPTDNIDMFNILQMNPVGLNLHYCQWWTPTGSADNNIYIVLLQRTATNPVTKPNQLVTVDIIYLEEETNE